MEFFVVAGAGILEAAVRFGAFGELVTPSKARRTR